jgi:hypothetical protein
MIYRTLFLLTFILFVGIQFSDAQENVVPDKDSAYFESTLRQFAHGNNLRRYYYLKKYTRKDSLLNLKVKTEAIDWLGIYRNVIIEKSGECDSIVYVVCHYDKVDGNIFSMVNQLINGNLDIILSNFAFTQGAYDNGTGVVSLLGLLSWINSKSTHYTYRFLFTGMEEYGLRGSRRHISGLKKDDWDRCFYAINIDMVGKKGKDGITASQNVSDRVLLLVADKICADSNYVFKRAMMADGALSDYYFFKGQSFFKDFGMSFMGNFSGAFIPQRSYFTGHKKGIPVINFTDDAQLTAAECFSACSPVSFGEVHSFNDRLKVIDPANLVEYNCFLKDYIMFIDNRKSLKLNSSLIVQ